MTQDELKKLITYNPETGILKWIKPRNTRSAKPKNISDGFPHNKGYMQIGINKKPYLVHRIIWLYMTGNFPKHQIDHINGIKTDNRFANLREVTNQQNNFNNKAKGYCFVKDRNKYLASICVNGKNIHLGLFATKEEARASYLEAKITYHGKEFMNRTGAF
jgi:hypothetical protein